METLKHNTQYLIAGALFLLMMATRFHHFGSVLHLPDASLAIFFLAGIYLTNRSYLVLYLLEAGLVDYVAISNGASDWCVSPAYGFLVPTYFTLWYAGRWYAGHYKISINSTVPFLLCLFAASTLAFFISNSSFYWFSGKFTDLNWVEYSSGVTAFYWPYLSSAFGYAFAAFSMNMLLISVVARDKAFFNK